MRSIKGQTNNTIVIDKSEFICVLINIEDKDLVNNHLDKLKNDYPGANHYCYAYIIGDNAQYQKASDDGEPSKTAGIPMLEVLKKNEITNILAVVIRYFGGIKLGAGGLIRAYSKSVSEALNLVTFTNLNEFIEISITYAYHYHNTIKNYIDNEKFTVINETFTSNVRVDLLILTNIEEEFINKLVNITKNEIEIKKGDTKVIYL